MICSATWANGMPPATASKFAVRMNGVVWPSPVTVGAGLAGVNRKPPPAV